MYCTGTDLLWVSERETEKGPEKLTEGSCRHGCRSNSIGIVSLQKEVEGRWLGLVCWLS